MKVRERKKLIDKIIYEMKDWDPKALLEWAQVQMKEQLEKLDDNRLDVVNKVYSHLSNSDN